VNSDMVGQEGARQWSNPHDDDDDKFILLLFCVMYYICMGL
jgi:hypothetical protein